LLPSRPAEATFLTEDERRWITEELDQEERQKRGTHKISAVEALTNGRVWHLACIGFTLNIGMYSLSFWMPQFVKSLSILYSNTTIGFLVMIPYFVGLLTMVLVSRSSDRKMERKYHAAIPAVIAGIALVSLGETHSAFSSIFFLCFAALGIYSVYGPFWSLPSEFLTGFAAASGIALISSVANLGGFVGPYAVGIVSQRTGSLYGGLALTGVSLFVCATLASLLPKRRAYG
jgi:ACS family tartrate transporter-like MFS transporter